MSQAQGSGAGNNAVSTRRGVELGVTAFVMWGLLTIYWKRLAGFDAIEVIAWRMMCAGVVMAIIVTARRSWGAMFVVMRRRADLGRLSLAAVLLATNWGCYVWAVGQGRILEIALGYFLAPLFTMLVGVFFLDEHPTRPQRFAFVAAAIAVVIITLSYGHIPWIALFIGANWSGYALAKRRSPLGPIESLAGETFISFAPAVVILIALAGHADSVVHTATAPQWALVLGTGVITAVPLILFAAAAQSIPFTLLGPLNLIVPVINVVLGWIVYGEPMPAERLVGFAFVWIALAAVTWDQVSVARQVDEPIAVA